MLYMVAVVFAIFFIGTTLLIMDGPKKEEPIEPEPQINDTIYEIVPIDTTIVINNKPWPIKVVSVTKNTDKFIDGKWQVITENGVMYYTNERTYVGQIAFYLNDNDEIVNMYGKNELDPKEWR